MSEDFALEVEQSGHEGVDLIILLYISHSRLGLRLRSRAPHGCSSVKCRLSKCFL